MLIAVLNIVPMGIIAFFLWRKQPAGLKSFFIPTLGLKLLAAIMVGLIYRYYYRHGDTFDLFSAAQTQTQIFHQSPKEWIRFMAGNDEQELMGYLRATYFVKIISTFNIFTGNNYWITALWFSFIGFLASWKLFRTVTFFFDDAVSAAAFALLLFPSIIFWSSGIMKETLALAGLYFLGVIFLKLYMRQLPLIWEWLIGLISVWITWNLKYYWIALFVPFALVALLVDRTHLSNSKWNYVFSGLAIVVIGIAVQFVHPNFYPGYFLKILVINHDGFIPLTAPDNMIHYANLQPTWGSVLLNVPLALWSGFFRPLPLEGHGTLAWIPSVENMFILILVVSSFNLKRLASGPQRLLTFFVLTYCIILCVFLALSTPNLGSLARYKVGFMPFFIFVVSYRNPLFDKIVNSILRIIRR
jgi:hypothetical protein